MARKALVAVGAVVIAAALLSPLWGPLLLRRLPWFDVRRVEVSGTRLLAPHEVMAASRIVEGQSLWEDVTLWEEALRAHPAIAEAVISRRVWSRSLRVQVVEKRPVAFIGRRALRPVTSRGEVLDVDPTRAPVDLPVLDAPEKGLSTGVISDTTTRALLAEIARLGQLDAELVLRLSDVRGDSTGNLLLTLSHPRAEVVLPRGSGYDRLQQIRAVLEEVQRRADERVAPGSIRVDLRFRDQVVVRLSPSA